MLPLRDAYFVSDRANVRPHKRSPPHMSPRKTVVKLVLTLAALALLPTSAVADCSEAESSADEAYTYSRRALRESNFDDAQSLMRRARNAAEEAQSEAEECECDDAASYADDAYTNARRGYNASNLRELRYYAERAMKAADAARSAATSCD